MMIVIKVAILSWVYLAFNDDYLQSGKLPLTVFIEYASLLISLDVSRVDYLLMILQSLPLPKYNTISKGNFYY